MEPEKVTMDFAYPQWTEDAIDIVKNPMFVIADVGCTTSMGSWKAVGRFLKAGKALGIRYKWKICNNFSILL